MMRPLPHTARPVLELHHQQPEGGEDDGELSPGGVWHTSYGEALSPGANKRNTRLHMRTPSRTHLGEETVAWLARHQEAARNRLERRCNRMSARGTSPTRAAASVALLRLRTGSWGAATGA